MKKRIVFVSIICLVCLLCFIFIAFRISSRTGKTQQSEAKDTYVAVPQVMVDDVVYGYGGVITQRAAPEDLYRIGKVERELNRATENFSAASVAVDSPLFKSKTYPGCIFAWIEVHEHYVSFVAPEIALDMIFCNGSLYISVEELNNSQFRDSYSNSAVTAMADGFETTAHRLQYGAVERIPTDEMETNNILLTGCRVYINPALPSTVYVEKSGNGTSSYLAFLRADSVELDFSQL